MNDLDGQLKCCGTSLFLKTTFGEGYILTLVKKGTRNLREGDDLCEGMVVDPWTSSKDEVTSTITQCISTAYLKEETRE